MTARIEDVHGIGPTVARAEALHSEMWRVRSAEAVSTKELISRGIVKEKALPAVVDHSSHVRYVRNQGAFACGMNAEAAVWDILLDMYCPPNFHPNISVNRIIWAWKFPLSSEPAKIPGLGPPAAVGSALTSTNLAGSPRVYFLTMDITSSWVAELAYWSNTSNWVLAWVSHDADGPAAAVGSALTSTTLGGNPRVYYLGDDHHVHELAWSGSKWSYRAVSHEAGGPAAAAGSALSSTTLGGNPRVYYLADDHRVHELAWLGSKWSYRAVSQDAGGPPAAAGSALMSTTLGGNPRVYYLADDHRVHELAWSGSKWSYRAVSHDAGGPAAAAGSALTSITLGGNPRVYYLADDHRVHELAWSGSKWIYRAVSQDTGGPAAAAGSALTSTTLEGNPRVYYLADDHRVHELAWSGSKWIYRAVSHDAGGPAATAGSALTSTTLGGNPSVYYLADDHRVHELAWSGSTWIYRAVSHDAGSYTSYEDYLYYEGCATEGSELTNSDAVQWPTAEGDHEISNFRLDRHVLAKPREYRAAVPVTVDDLRYWLSGGPVRVELPEWRHFVALVGYDDTAQRFKFVNSWGDQWGENGFGYVDYSELNAKIGSAQVYMFKLPKAMPCLRVKLSHNWRQDVYLWVGVEGTMKCKRIWPTGQRQDGSHNLWLTVTLPEGFAWPPTQQNRVYIDVYDCGAHSTSGGFIEEVLTGYNGNYVASADLGGGPVPFGPGKVTRLTVP